MTASAIEAVYLYDQNNEVVVEHKYISRPPSARACLQAYLSQPAPRAAVSHHATALTPATTLVASRYHQQGLLMLVPATRESDPLAALTFAGRLFDVLEDLLGGGPLTAGKIAASYDVVAQILAETVDGGNVATTEPNALRDAVATQGWVGKLLGGVGLPSGPAPLLSSSSLTGIGNTGVGGLGSGVGGGGGGFRPKLRQNPSAGPQVPWRRPNVRHTSNELWVDMIESLHVLLAPSGRPLSARVHGSILFTAKISGVPDLLLSLTVPGGGPSQVGRVVEAPVFHPCVRLNRWRDNPGELSFVPPDGKFMLAAYEVDLLPPPTVENGGLTGRSAKRLNLPVNVEVRKSLGVSGTEFEVRLTISGSIGLKGGSGAAAAQLRAISGGGGSSGQGSGRSTPSFFGGKDSGTSNAPTLRDIVVQVPIPPIVRNITDMRASRGDASFDVSTHIVEWRIGHKEAADPGNATLRCIVMGPVDDDDDGDGKADTSYRVTGMGDYDENADAYQASEGNPKPATSQERSEDRDAKKVSANRACMPTAATVSFSVKGWLASGLKVESLNIDTRKSRGLGDGVKPVKGVKYLTVSKQGVETRC